MINKIDINTYKGYFYKTFFLFFWSLVLTIGLCSYSNASEKKYHYDLSCNLELNKTEEKVFKIVESNGLYWREEIEKWQVGLLAETDNIVPLVVFEKQNDPSDSKTYYEIYEK